MLRASIRRLTILLVAAVLSLPSGVRAGGPDLEGSEAEIRQAQNLAATLRRADGIERAFGVLCRESRIDRVRHGTAVTVLVERAAAAMPRLLDLIAAGEAPAASGRDAACSEEARDVVAAAVCEGRHDADFYQVDRRSEAAVEHGRTAAQQAIIGALAKPGVRRRTALEVLRRTRTSGAASCSAAPELVERATPALVQMLSSRDHETEVLRVFAGSAGDARIAVPAVRPYLADRARLPLAALALARMGQDMSQAVGRLAESLDGPEADAALEALQRIGVAARAAMPRVAALARRMNASCTTPVAAQRLVETVRSIGLGREDAGLALGTLSPILARCPSAITPTADVISYLGNPGHDVLVDYLRNEDQTIGDRLIVGHFLRTRFHDADRDLMRRLEAKSHEPPVESQVQREPPARDPLATASDEVAACRAEAGLTPVAITGITAGEAAELGSCVQQYLCGPSRAVLARTLDRCCGRVFRSRQPAFCRL